MSPLKEGDRVRVRERAVTVSDVKSGLYFAHFPGLTGTIEKIYEGQEACVDVDLESLPPSVRARHQEIESDMRRKWLDGLSDEARNRLSEAEKQFHLKYAILVQVSDLEPFKGGAARQPAARSREDARPAKAVTSKDLDQAEEAFLQEMLKRAQRQ